MPAPLHDRRFIVVSGKGGSGRTTVAAALARAQARAGRRVLLVQMESPDRLARLLGHPHPIGPEISAVAPGLAAVNMTPRTSLHEYGRKVLHYEALARAVFDNRAVRAFLGAVPGLDAYSMLGKTWWHTTEMDGDRPRYDLVILDGPASGHATKMLSIPDAILAAMPRGPLAPDARAMRTLFSDGQRCAFVIVTLPEELPARETSELAREVTGKLHMPLGPLIVNGLPAASLARPELGEVLARAVVPTGDPELDATLAGAGLLRRRRQEAEHILHRLRDDPGLPIIELPRLPGTDLGPADIDVLASALDAYSITSNS